MPGFVLIPGLNVLVHAGAFGPEVGHSYLLPLIYKGRALQKQICRRQTFAALGAVFFAAVAGDYAGMVVVFQIQHVPRPAVKLPLPGAEGQFHQRQGERDGHVIREKAVGAHALELYHHVQLPVGLGDILQRLFRRYHGRFGQGHAVVVRQGVAAELGEIIVYMRAVVIVGQTL